MPWSAQNPITGIRRWKPTEKDILEEAVACYSWLLIYDYEYPRKKFFTYAELAEAIRSTYDTDSDTSEARRNRIFAQALERHPRWKFFNPNYK